MTFQQLQYILEVQRTGSISRAAENLFVSRSSVSSSISSVENELGYPIFVRTLQGLIPSEKGNQVLEYADRICKTHQLMTNLSEPANSRLVSIGINNYAPVVNAAASLVEKYKDRTDVRFSFGVYKLNEIIDKLCLFEIEAAVFSRLGNIRFNIENTLESRGLQWKILTTVPTTLIVGKNHPCAEKPLLTLRDLENDLFIDTMANEITKNSYIRSAMKIRPERILVTNNTSLKFRLIQQGIGYTVGRLPRQNVIDNYDLRCIPIQELSQPLIFAVNPKHQQSEETKAFLKLLEDNLKTQGL